MSIVIVKTDVVRRPDEFAPMACAETRAALRGVHWAATPLYLEVMALPDGFSPPDEWLRGRLGWTVTMLRKAKAGLHAAGLYLWDDVRTASGNFVRVCRYVTNVARSALSQVGPSDPLATVGQGAPIPPSREIKREGRTEHHPDTCRRNADGLPCRQCAKALDRESRTEKASAARPLLPCDRPAAAVLEQETETEQVETEPALFDMCEHGKRRASCVSCITGKPDRTRRLTTRARRR